MISVKNISYSYNTIPLLKDISFCIDKGEFVALIGPSGCGKSTLANIIAGHLRPLKGSVIIDKVDVVRKPGRHVFLINQENDLFPWQNVFSQISFAQKIEDDEEVKRLIALVKLTGFEDYYPSQLSGGMKKRLSIARALAVKPELIVFDESFSFLDFDLKIVLLKDLKEILETTNTSILMISHDERDFKNLIVKTIRLV